MQVKTKEESFECWLSSTILQREDEKKVKDTPPQTFLKYFEHASEKTSYKLNNKEK